MQFFAPLWRTRRRLTAAPSVHALLACVCLALLPACMQRSGRASGSERYKLFVQRVYYAHTASSKSPESFGSCSPSRLDPTRVRTLPPCPRAYAAARAGLASLAGVMPYTVHPRRAGRIPVPEGGSGTLALLSRASRMRREACPTLARENDAWGNDSLSWRGLTRGLPARSLSPGFVNIAPRAA